MKQINDDGVKNSTYNVENAEGTKLMTKCKSNIMRNLNGDFKGDED